MGAGLSLLNGNSATLTGGSSEIQNALLEIQKQLNEVSVSTDQIDELVNGYSQIKTGIGSLSQGISDLQTNVDFGTYKSVMAANGLDIDALQAGNSNAIAAFNNQIAQLEDVIYLLQGNNAAIYGMDGYLTEVNTNIGGLAQGATDIQTNYEIVDA